MTLRRKLTPEERTTAQEHDQQEQTARDRRAQVARFRYGEGTPSLLENCCTFQSNTDICRLAATGSLAANHGDVCQSQPISRQRFL